MLSEQNERSASSDMVLFSNTRDSDIQMHESILDSFTTALKSSVMEHFEVTKNRLVYERVSELREQTDLYEERIQNLSSELNSLTLKYQSAEEYRDKERDKNVERFDRFSRKYERQYVMHMSPSSVKNIFFQWKLAVLKRRKYVHLSRVVVYQQERSLMKKIFFNMHRGSMILRFARKERENSAQVGELARQVYSSYRLYFKRI